LLKGLVQADSVGHFQIVRILSMKIEE
jgi:hypothetical protein